MDLSRLSLVKESYKYPFRSLGFQESHFPYVKERKKKKVIASTNTHIWSANIKLELSGGKSWVYETFKYFRLHLLQTK